MPDDRPSSARPSPDAPLNEAHVRLVLQAAGMGLWCWDVPADAFTIDARFAGMIGRPGLAGTAFGSDLIAEMTHPDDREKVAAELAKSLERDEYGFETLHRAVTPDGDIVWLHAKATVTERGPDGKPLTISGLVENCTEQRRLTEEHESERRRSDLVLEASRAGVWDWDIEAGEIFWSEQLRQMLGVPAHAPVNFRTLEAHIHPDDLDFHQECLQAHLNESAPFSLTIRMVRTDGEMITVRVRGKAERGAQGAPVRMAGSAVDITAESEALRAAAAADARANLALDAAGLFVIEQDLLTRQIDVPGRLADLLGRPDLAGFAIPHEEALAHVHVEDLQAVHNVYSELAEGRRTTIATEFRIVRSDGEQRWLMMNTLRPKAADGSLDDRLICVINDVTERKHGELALADANERFERAVEGSLIAIWDWDIANDRLYWSKRMYELLGLDPDTQRVETVRDVTALVHPEDLERMKAVQADHFEKDAPFELKYRMIRPDGEIVHVIARGAASRDEAGSPIRFSGSLIDVTAQHKAEEAARIAGARVQSALEAARLGLWEYNARTGKIVFDERLASILGRLDLANTEIDQETAFNFTADHDLKEVKAKFVGLTTGEFDVARTEHRIVNADGREVWILAHIVAPERDEEGRPVRLIGITQDLTERKAIEDDLRNAKERAEAANAAKSTFLATMSHEIRTPLNGVLGMAQLLSLGALDDKQKRYAETILSSGRSLAAIIDDVLDISRIEAGRLTLKPTPVKPSDIITETLEPLRGQAEEKGLELSVRIDESLQGERRVDPTRMGQVLRNLVSNAIKFTPAGQIEVSAVPLGADAIRVAVRDQGPGVSPELQSSIFERFTQADMSTKRAHGGAGLGLAIARELTELAGGEIGVDSQPGQGAVFWFEIPAPPPRPDPDAERRPHAEDVGVPDNARVLVVEDNAVNRAATAELLVCAGFQVSEADSADAALEELKAGAFDAVLLDLHMPGRGGDAVLKAVRNGEAGAPDVLVFLLTADVTTEARKLALSLRADGFFGKPADFNDIRRRLSAAIHAARKT